MTPRASWSCWSLLRAVEKRERQADSSFEDAPEALEDLSPSAAPSVDVESEDLGAGVAVPTTLTVPEEAVAAILSFVNTTGALAVLFCSSRALRAASATDSF